MSTCRGVNFILYLGFVTVEHCLHLVLEIKSFQIFVAVHNFSKIRIEKLKTIYISSAAKLILSNLSPNLSAYAIRHYLYKSTLMSNGESKSFNIACFVSFSERLACSVGIFQSIPRLSSRMLMPPSASG